MNGHAAPPKRPLEPPTPPPRPPTPPPHPHNTLASSIAKARRPMPTSNTFLEPLPRLRGKDQVRIQPLGTVRPSAGFHSPPGAAVRRPPSGGARAGMLRGAARSTSRVHVYHAGIRARCVRRATACMRTRGCALRDGVNRHLALARGMRGRCTRGWGRVRRGEVARSVTWPRPLHGVP